MSAADPWRTSGALFLTAGDTLVRVESIELLRPVDGETEVWLSSGQRLTIAAPIESIRERLGLRA